MVYLDFPPFPNRRTNVMHVYYGNTVSCHSIESNFRASRKLELVHFDLCGPMPTPSANGNKYFLTFVDDYSRMWRIYCLKTKSEVFQTFKDFHALIEKQANKKLVHFILTMGKNTLQMILKIIFANMIFHIRIQFPTILNKMV